jgi:biopolymer transport protein ExbB
MQVTEREAGIGRQVLLWMAVVVLMAAPVSVMAQDDAAKDAAKDAVELVADGPEADDEKDESLLTLIVGTGPTGWLFMGLLLVFSFFSVTVAIERAVATRRINVLPDDFLSGVEELSSSSRPGLKAFRELCSNCDAPVARVVEAGLERCGRPLTEIEKSMEDRAAREIAKLRGGIRPLQTVGSIAPLIGLLGTVVGMIVAFRTASQAGLGRGERMAEGIYLALTTTAAGLTIAIPTLLLSAVFTARVERFFREMAEKLAPTILCLENISSDGSSPSAGTTTETTSEESSG